MIAASYFLIVYKNVEDNGGYLPPLIIYISNAYVIRGGYSYVFKTSVVIAFSSYIHVIRNTLTF